MRCPHCDADTPDGAKFCIECGTPLQPGCPQCGADTLPRAKFCAEYGVPLTARTPMPPAAPAPSLLRYTPEYLPEKILTSKEEKRVLQTAAVIGTDVPFTLLQALAYLPEPGDTRMLALELSLALERALRPLGEFGRNLALLGKAEALARALDDRTRLGWVLAQMATVLRITGDHGLGRLYGQTCRAEPGRAALTAAIDLYRAMNMTFWLPQTEAALAQVEGR